MFIRNSRVSYLVHGTAMQCQSYVSQEPCTENRFYSHQEKKRTRFIRNYCTNKDDLSEKYRKEKFTICINIKEETKNVLQISLKILFSTLT